MRKNINRLNIWEEIYPQLPDKVTTEHQGTLLPGLGYLKVLEPSFAQVTPFTHMLKQFKWILFDLHNFASERDSWLPKGWRKNVLLLKGREGLWGALTDYSLPTNSYTRNQVKQISQNCLSIYSYFLVQCNLI